MFLPFHSSLVELSINIHVNEYFSSSIRNLSIKIMICSSSSIIKILCLLELNLLFSYLKKDHLDVGLHVTIGSTCFLSAVKYHFHECILSFVK